MRGRGGGRWIGMRALLATSATSSAWGLFKPLPTRTVVNQPQDDGKLHHDEEHGGEGHGQEGQALRVTDDLHDGGGGRGYPWRYSLAEYGSA
jgi:hypothetical protein